MSYLFRSGLGVVDLSSVPASVRNEAAAAHPELIDQSIPGSPNAGMSNDFIHHDFGVSFSGRWAAPVWVPDVQDMLDYQAMYRAEQNSSDMAALQAANAAAGADTMRGFVCNADQTACAHTQAALSGVTAPNASAGTPISVAVAPPVSVPSVPSVSSTPIATHTSVITPPAQSQVVSTTPGASMSAPAAPAESVSTPSGFSLSDIPLWGWLAVGAAVAFLAWPKGGR